MKRRRSTGEIRSRNDQEGPPKDLPCRIRVPGRILHGRGASGGRALAQLLAERRGYPRCPIQLPLLYRSKDPSSVAAGAGWTQNLCMGGALVELAEHLPPQTPLSILLQTDEGSVALEVQVVWTREHAALGGVLHAVMFTQRPPEIIEDLLLTQGEARIPRVRLPTDLDITCWSKGVGPGPLQGRAADAGRGGLLLCLPEGLSPGSAVELSLHTSEVPVLAGGTI